MKNNCLARFCSIFLLAALLVSLTVPLASAYSDVTRSAFPDYFDAINYVTDKGLMNGTSSTQFEPNSFVSRAMVVTTLYRMAGSPQNYSAISFTDVSSSDWYYNPIRWAVKVGIATGVTTTTFEPNSMVTREQALTFFLRYLKNFEKRTAYYHYSITYCGDYSQIDSYAVASFRWAVSNGIVYPDSSANNKLYPKSYVYRRELALWLCRYGTNIWGIRQNTDAYRFSNVAGSFVSGSSTRRLITQKHWNKLISLATSSEMTQLSNNLNYHYPPQWAGSCYGMSASMTFNKLGKIDLTGNFAKNCSTVYDIPSPKNYSDYRHIVVNDKTSGQISAIESVINYYQLSQDITSRYNTNIGGGRWTRPNATFDWFTDTVYSPNSPGSLQELVEHQRKSNLTLAGVGWTIMLYPQGGDPFESPQGHALILYGTPKTENGYYVINVYDSSAARGSTLKIKTDYSAAYYVSTALDNGSVMLDYVQYYKNYYIFNSLDLDGDNNNVALYMDDVIYDKYSSGEYTYLYVDMIGDFTIRNNEGEYLQMQSGRVCGDMPLHSVNYLINEAGRPVTAVICVNTSERFYFDTTAPYVGFEFLNSTQYSAVTGTNIETVEVGISGVNITGDNMDYQICSNHGCTQNYYVTYAGSGESNCELYLENGGMKLCAKEQVTVTTFDNRTADLIEKHTYDGLGMQIDVSVNPENGAVCLLANGGGTTE